MNTLNAIDAATKVIHGGYWYAVVDGILYTAPMLADGSLGAGYHPVERLTLDESQIHAALMLALPPAPRRPVAPPPGYFSNPATTGLTAQQRADAADILRGTKLIPLRPIGPNPDR